MHTTTNDNRYTPSQTGHPDNLTPLPIHMYIPDHLRNDQEYLRRLRETLQGGNQPMVAPRPFNPNKDSTSVTITGTGTTTLTTPADREDYFQVNNAVKHLNDGYLGIITEVVSRHNDGRARFVMVQWVDGNVTRVPTTLLARAPKAYVIKEMSNTFEKMQEHAKFFESIRIPEGNDNPAGIPQDTWQKMIDRHVAGDKRIVGVDPRNLRLRYEDGTTEELRTLTIGGRTRFVTQKGRDISDLFTERS